MRAFWKGDPGDLELRWSWEEEGFRPVLPYGIELLRKQDQVMREMLLDGLCVPQAWQTPVGLTP